MKMKKKIVSFPFILGSAYVLFVVILIALRIGSYNDAFAITWEHLLVSLITCGLPFGLGFWAGTIKE